MKLLFAYKNSHVALSIKVATILFATLAIYHQDLAVLGNEAIRSELMSHTLAVPLLFTYLLYRKRKMLRAAISFETFTPKRKTTFPPEVFGALLWITAFLFYWHGSYTFLPLEHHMASLPLFIAGCTLIVFNIKTLKVLAFPIAFLLFLTPPPLQIIYATGTTLSAICLEAVYIILKAIGLSVTLSTQYGIPVLILKKSGEIPLTFAMDVACAGIYSLIGFTIFAVFIAYIAEGTTWKKVTIILAGFPLIYALNVTRIIIIVLIGSQYGIEAATQAFHLLGGWVLIFLGALILFTLPEKLWKIQLFTKKPKVSPCNYCNQNPTTKQHFCPACGRTLNPINIKFSKRDLTKMFILTISAILIINLQAPVFALTEGPAEVTIQTLGGEQTVTQILPEVPGYATKFIFRDRRFEERAKQDASLAYLYKPADASKTTVWVTIEIAKTRSSLHRWEACLITWPLSKGYQPRVTQLSLRDVQLLQNPPITARYFAFQDKKSSITQVVLYWYENALFNIGSSQEQEHVKISLIAFANKPEDVPAVEELLLLFGRAIVNYWQPIKTWSQIALTIAQNGALLTTIPTTFLAIILIVHVIQKQKEKKSNLKIYNKLALKEERLILQAVHQASKENKPTGNIIASCYEKLTGKPIELNPLLQKLNEAEEAGLIKREITNQEDEPTLLWKSQIPL